MNTLIFALVAGTLLLLASLHLEKQEGGKNTKSYKSLKYIGGTGAVMAWVGLIILGLLF